ncbi:MAG TPA: glutathione S-transferase [Hellea balneolensis]|uniref:Glutathione S-transferase n=1 Tax=Hellea balneolensis TaxID=287478 RepID=A0A7V5NXT0_9PROT|nr:glutathione S-transferase [Hellea balneolensis]
MKLIISKTSPYSRKCRILVREKNLDVAEIETRPFEDEAFLHEANPLGKVPALVREEGPTLYDSPVICEYLDSLDTPWRTGDIWRQKTLHALGDGMIDAVLTFRLERIRPPELWWDFVAMRQENAIGRAVFHLESIVDDLGAPWSYGNLAIACALGYMDFRAPDVEWRTHAPKLAKWFEAFEALDSYKDTAPPEE